MKHLLFLLLLFISVSLSAQSFKGKWQGTSNGEVGVITFDKAGYVTFTIAGESMGGKKFNSGGVDLSMRYVFNNQVDPHTIDFIMTMIDGGTEVGRMVGIYKFINAKTMLLSMDFSGAARPTKFDEDSETQIELKKIK